MKTKLYSIMLAVAAVIGLGSCDNGMDPNPSAGKGQLKLGSLTVDVDAAESEVSRAGVNTDNFSVVITPADGGPAYSYVYAQMPEIITLPVGDYTVSVESHELQKAEWDKPYYAGSKDFKIVDGQITEIGAVTCTFQSLKVTVSYSDELKAAMAQDCKVVVVANDEGRLTFEPAETRVGCFAVVEGSNTLVASFSGTVGGSPAQVLKTFNNVAPGQHYKLTFAIKGVTPGVPDEYGQIAIADGITVDLSVVDENIDSNLDDEEDVIANPTRPGADDPEKPGQPDQPITPDDPVIPDDPSDYTLTITSETFDLDVPNTPGEGSYVVMINSSLGLAHLYVDITTDSEAFRSSAGEMVPLNFDLAYPEKTTGEYNGLTATQALSNLQFPMQNDVIGANEVTFDITGFVPLLGAFPGTHNFKLTVVDAAGHQSVKTLTFVAQ